MARHLDPKCKQCRREGIKLFLKGNRCESPKCPIEKREGKLPGMHFQRRGKPSEYAKRLREKQKLKRFYGVFERQFQRYYELATRSPENTGEQLLTIMERRLDNVVHRLGFAPNRVGARQMVSHGHVLVNGRVCNIPSMLVKANDVVAVKARTRTLKLVNDNVGKYHEPIPDYLQRIDGEAPSGRVMRLPTRDDVDPRIRDIQEQLIIEFCSR